MDKLHISNDIAIDFGSAMTRIFIKGRGIVLEEPSVIAYDTISGETVAVGYEAQLMTGKTPPGITVSRPMTRGLICEVTLAEELLRRLLRKVCGKTLIKPSMVLAVPSSATQVQERALCEAALGIGARSVRVVKSGIAAALGAGADIMSERARFVVDFGEGKCEISVVAKGQVIYTYEAENGAAAFDAALADFLKDELSVIAGSISVAACKEEIGCVEASAGKTATVYGSGTVTLCPTEVEITSEQVMRALQPVADSFTEEVKAAVIDMPSELLADVLEGGIILTGGGARTEGLAERLRTASEMKVTVPAECERCVIKGLGALCENPSILPRDLN